MFFCLPLGTMVIASDRPTEVYDIGVMIQRQR